MPLKHLVCVGYAKCGTTMLNSVFRRSGQIAVPLKEKELKFFLPANFPSANPYRKYILEFTPINRKADYAYTFEASPPYSHTTPENMRRAFQNIRATLPNCEIILCVRHPVLRMYSHYIHDLHSFGLYGAGVFSRKAQLSSRPFAQSFVETIQTRRMLTRYSEHIQLLYDYFGRLNVKVFFLEWDTTRFRDWVRSVTDDRVADELELKADSPERVIPRRPLPNYAVLDKQLFAFGSRKGELVVYKDLSTEQIDSIRQAQRRWTLSLSEEEIRQITGELFTDDLRESSEITGDPRFADYLTVPTGSESAMLTGSEALSRIHGVGAAARSEAGTH